MITVRLLPLLLCQQIPGILCLAFCATKREHQGLSCAPLYISCFGNLNHFSEVSPKYLSNGMTHKVSKFNQKVNACLQYPIMSVMLFWPPGRFIMCQFLACISPRVCVALGFQENAWGIISGSAQSLRLIGDILTRRIKQFQDPSGRLSEP